MLDLHRLRVFRAVIASGSVHAAAANLGYTASAISQHVAALQRETGLALVTRAGRGIAPTSAGLALAREIDGVLSQVGTVERLIADLRTQRTGSLSIAYFASIGAAWMPAVVRTLLRELPGLRLDLSLRDDIVQPPQQRPDIQVAVERPGYDPGAGMRAHHLIDDPYVAVLPSGHPLAGAGSIELGRLSGERWIDNDFARGQCRQNLIEACQSAGFSPPFHVEAHDYPTAIAFVDAGIGVSILPRLGARNLPPGVTAVPLTCPTPMRRIYALVPAGGETTAGVRAALAALVGCAEAARSRPPGSVL